MVALVHRFWTAAVEHEAKERRMMLLCVRVYQSREERNSFVCVYYISHARASDFVMRIGKKKSTF
jgi:hypothetical protein